MKQSNRTRRYVQLFFLSVSAVIFGLLISGVFEIAHAWCPHAMVCFGCLNLGQQLGERFFPIAAGTGIVLLISAIFIGRRFCGYVCPFGTIQELIFELNPRSKQLNKRNLIKTSTHRYLKYLKYVVLVAVALLSGLGMSYIYMQFCPVMTIGHIQAIGLAGVLTLVVILLVGYFIERFWCNYLCPFAALLNIVQFLGRILHIPRHKIYWNKESCNHCGLCHKSCPMRIDILSHEKVEDVECIYCDRCRQICPQNKGGKKVNNEQESKFTDNSNSHTTHFL